MAEKQRVIKPASDSRPIRMAELLDYELEHIHQANRLLGGMQKYGSQLPRSTNDPWAIADANRQHRVIMINGGRGTGKTSLMFTLLAGWRAAATHTNDDDNWKILADPKDIQKAKNLFSDMGSVLRALPPLDFDPLPPDLPLYGWIIQAFKPLVNWLMRDPALEQSRYDSERDVEHLASIMGSATFGHSRQSARASIGREII